MRTQERAYYLEEIRDLSGIEIYRRRNAAATDPLHGAIQVERETLHVMGDTRRVAMVETLTEDLPGNAPISVEDTRWRYH